MSRQYKTLCRVNVKPLQNTEKHKKIFNTKNMAAFVNLPRKNYTSQSQTGLLVTMLTFSKLAIATT